MIPIDPIKCPYALFTSHGIHTHPPPPPSKAPKAILLEIAELIKRMRNPDLTTSKLVE